MSVNPSPQESHYNQARASLQQALSWYSSLRRHWNYPPNLELQAAVKKDLQALKGTLEKLEEKIIRIAAFGLVSRGKSSVINALVGKKVLQTGPLHGVTQWPRAVHWDIPSEKIQVEFIDTPGLDEIAGEARATMARDVARQADLILFVVSGDITRSEYTALCELRRSQKPVILVFNKIDLYPEKERREIYQQLQKLGVGNPAAQGLETLSPEEIVMVAAEPQAIPVRLEWADGRTSQEWEHPAPQIDELREKIFSILNREGRTLLALNSLYQAQEATQHIAQKTLEIRREEADNLIWRYAKYKALGVAVNPIGVIDILGGCIADLTLIRALARLYGLPMTSHEAGKLWQTVLMSSGFLCLGELVTGLFLGLGKSAAALGGMWESPAALTLYGSTALAQGSLAGYGSYRLGKAAQIYLEQGCTWGNLGPSTVIEQILSQVDSQTIIYRLRLELFNSQLGL